MAGAARGHAFATGTSGASRGRAAGAARRDWTARTSGDARRARVGPGRFAASRIRQGDRGGAVGWRARRTRFWHSDDVCHQVGPPVRRCRHGPRGPCRTQDLCPATEEHQQSSRRFSMMQVVLAVVVLALSMPLGADAQTGEASLRGYVRDEQGGVLPGVVVTASGPAIMTPATATTDAAGYYRLVNLPPGTYVLKAELSGFSIQQREGINVRAGSTFQMDVVMQLGNVQETVTVSG